MTRRRHITAHCAALIVVGLLLIAWLHERDARRRAESQALQFAQVVTDMIGYQIEQVRAKTYRLERLP